MSGLCTGHLVFQLALIGTVSQMIGSTELQSLWSVIFACLSMQLSLLYSHGLSHLFLLKVLLLWALYIVIEATILSRSYTQLYHMHADYACLVLPVEQRWCVTLVCQCSSLSVTYGPSNLFSFSMLYSRWSWALQLLWEICILQYRTGKDRRHQIPPSPSLHWPAGLIATQDGERERERERERNPCPVLHNISQVIMNRLMSSAVSSNWGRRFVSRKPSALPW